MKSMAFAFIVLTTLGCANTTKVDQALIRDSIEAPYGNIQIKNDQSKAPAHFLDAIQSYLEQDLSKNALLRAGQGYNVEIEVVAYRMRSGFTRQFFGVFAWKDNISSIVRVSDPISGKLIGKSTVTSFNVLPFGEQEDIARMHAIEIARFLYENQSAKHRNQSANEKT